MFRRQFQTIVLFAVCTGFIVLAISAPLHAAKKYTYRDLVKRLTDLEHLAVLPDDGEYCRQWSSYDRHSRYDAEHDRYIDWGANGDGNQFIRKEGDQIVMAEMKGPGCIWRIWSALAKEGHVKIYLDGNTQPAVDLPFEQYFTGKTKPFAYPALSYQLTDVGSRGHNLYVPIPFQKSCKVVADKGWGAYFHFTYSVFPKGTIVPTFKTPLSAEDDAALQRVNHFFQTQLGTDPAGKRPGQTTVADTIVVPAGSTEQLELSGPAAITAIRGAVACTDRKDEIEALRQLVLSITFDGHSKPAVWSPLGDFFGTAPGKNLYRSLLTGMTKDGFYAYWYMPFAKHATIQLRNDGSKDREIRYEVVVAPLARPFAGLGHFHAKWHRDLTPVRPDRKPDWVILKTKGRGRFCGVMLDVWNPRGGWWGEGDEKFFVDGEHFPSTIGTGSEDYFGYAWCNPALFQFAYHCQTMSENNRGHQSVLRWHVVDNVPFHTEFEACIEKYFDNARGTKYACLPCFYLDPEHDDPIPTAPLDQRLGYYVRPPLGGAGFRVLGHPHGIVQEQGMAGWGTGKWKNDNQLWWTGAKPGDQLDVLFQVEKTGRYEVIVKLTKAIDYGIVQLGIDGKEVGKPIDLFHRGVVPSGPISLGAHQLAKGKHTLNVKIVGANPEAVKGYMFGLDEIILEPAR